MQINTTVALPFSAQVISAFNANSCITGNSESSNLNNGSRPMGNRQNNDIHWLQRTWKKKWKYISELKWLNVKAI